jgi:hypothetical protein
MVKTQYIKRYYFVAVLTMALVVVGCISTGEKASPQDDQAKAFNELKAQLTLVVEDKVRAGVALKFIDELEVDVKQLLGAISKRKQGFEDLNANYNTTREEFSVFFNAINNNIQLRSKEITTKYRRMQKLLTSAEQKQLNKYNSNLVKSFINVLEAA